MGELDKFKNIINKAKQNPNEIDNKAKYLKKYIENEETVKIIEAYNSIDEPKVKKYSKAVNFHNNELVVVTANPTATYDLTFIKQKLMDTVNYSVGKKVVLDIYFKVGDPTREQKKIEEHIEEDPIKDVELDQSEIDKIDNMVSTITDKKLRESMRNLFISSKKAEKVKKGNN